MTCRVGSQFSQNTQWKSSWVKTEAWSLVSHPVHSPWPLAASQRLLITIFFCYRKNIKKIFKIVQLKSWGRDKTGLKDVSVLSVRCWLSLAFKSLEQWQKQMWLLEHFWSTSIYCVMCHLNMLNTLSWGIAIGLPKPIPDDLTLLPNLVCDN